METGHNSAYCSMVDILGLLLLPVRCISAPFLLSDMSLDWGDTLSVTVKNSMQDNGTGIHWHGMRQLNTVGMDGTGGITECKIHFNQAKV